MAITINDASLGAMQRTLLRRLRRLRHSLGCDALPPCDICDGRDLYGFTTGAVAAVATVAETVAISVDRQQQLFIAPLPRAAAERAAAVRSAPRSSRGP